MVLSSSTDQQNFIQACQCCCKTAICGVAQVHHGCVKLLESGWFGNGGEGSRLRVVGESPPANENHRRTSVLRGKIKDLIDILDITGL